MVNDKISIDSTGILNKGNTHGVTSTVVTGHVLLKVANDVFPAVATGRDLCPRPEQPLFFAGVKLDAECPFKLHTPLS